KHVSTETNDRHFRTGRAKFPLLHREFSSDCLMRQPPPRYRRGGAGNDSHVFLQMHPENEVNCWSDAAALPMRNSHANRRSPVARPYWSGNIQISLVSFGVSLYVATESKNQIS